MKGKQTACTKAARNAVQVVGDNTNNGEKGEKRQSTKSNYYLSTFTFIVTSFTGHFC